MSPGCAVSECSCATLEQGCESKSEKSRKDVIRFLAACVKIVKRLIAKILV